MVLVPLEPAVVEVLFGPVNEIELESTVNVVPPEAAPIPDEVMEILVSEDWPMLTRLLVVVVPTALVRVCVNSPT